MRDVVAPKDVYLAPIGRSVDAGETVSVPDAVAESLLEQGWPDPSTPAAPAAKSSRRAKPKVGAPVQPPDPAPAAAGAPLTEET